LTKLDLMLYFYTPTSLTTKAHGTASLSRPLASIVTYDYPNVAVEQFDTAKRYPKFDF
jgi:hypothetical protein